MKRSVRKNLFLFGLPFVVIAAPLLRSKSPLTLEANHGRFSQEIARKIPIGMPVSQAETLLRNSGFSDGPPLIKPIPLGKTMPIVTPGVEEFTFSSSSRALPRVLDSHEWLVGISTRNGRVAKVWGQYYYRRWS